MKKEIETIDDFFNNAGYIIGPMAAGIIAEKFGNASVFLTIGVLGFVISLILLLITPKKIKMPSSSFLLESV